MRSLNEAIKWDETWGMSSGGKQDEMERTRKLGTSSNAATEKRQDEATGTVNFFGYLFRPDEAPNEQPIMTTKKGNESAGNVAVIKTRSNAAGNIAVIKTRSNASQVITPPRRRKEWYQGQRKVGQKRWFKPKKKTMQPQNGDELLGWKDGPIAGEGYKLQDQKQSETESSNFLSFLFEQSADEAWNHTPCNNIVEGDAFPEGPKQKQTTEKAGRPAEVTSLPFMDYLWRIEPLEFDIAAPTEVSHEKIPSQESCSQEDEEVPLPVPRRKRWFSSTPKRGDLGPKRNAQDKEEEQSSSWSEEETAGQGVSSEDSGREGNWDESHELDGQAASQRFAPLVEARDRDVHEEEEAYSEGRSCMPFRLPTRYSGRGGNGDNGDKSRELDGQLASRRCAPLVEARDRDEHGRSAGHAGLGHQSKVYEEDGAGVDGALEEEAYSESRSCMSFRRNPEARGGGIFLGRVRSKSNATRDSALKNNVARDEARLQFMNRQEHDRTPQWHELLPSPLPAKEQQIVPRQESKQEQDRKSRGKERPSSSLLAKEPQSLSRTSSSLPVKEQQIVPRQESKQEQERKSRGKERPSSSLSAKEPLSLSRTSSSLPVKEQQIVPRKESRQEQDRTSRGKERPSSSFPAKEPQRVSRTSSSLPVARRDKEDEMRPSSPKGAALWRGDMWNLLSLSVDSLDAEEPARYSTRKPIRIDRSRSNRKKTDPSIMAASWADYEDEDCYSDSSSSSVFSLGSLDA
jgi:hypothetical protein